MQMTNPSAYAVLASAVLSAAAAGAFPWSVVLERVDSPVETLWVRGHGDGAETLHTKEGELAVSVETRIEAPAGGTRVATASVRNGTRDWRVRRLYVRPFARALPDGFEAIYYSSGLGVRVSNMPSAADGSVAHAWKRAAREDGENRYRFRTKGFIHPDSFVYPCWTTTMQYLALAAAGGGVYWGCHDPSFAAKRILPLYDPARRELVHEVGYDLMLDPGREWRMAPNVEVEYRGSWHEAAKIYRRWFRSVQRPRPDMPKEMTGQVLCILKQQNGEIVWPYGEIDALVDVAKAHGLDWIGLFGWTVGGHDHLYPDYDPDPAQGGRDALVSGLRRIHERGLKCYLYANGQLQERDATDWWRTTGRHNAIVMPDGTTFKETWHKFSDAPAHTFDLGCLRAKPWRDRMLALARQAGDFGADGILYDQLGNSLPKPCYGRGHGHAPGQMAFAEDTEAFLRFIRDGMEKSRPGFLLLTEGLGDTFSDTIALYHGMCIGAYPFFHGPNVKLRLSGGANDGVDYFPEMFRYTFPEIVSTCRNNNPFIDRFGANYGAIFGLKHEIEVRYRPDRVYVETGRYPGDDAYSNVLGKPAIDRMRDTDQRTAQKYLKSVCDFQRRWSKYLLEGMFRDTDGCPVSGMTAKRFEAEDGTSAVLLWNVLDRPVAPVLAPGTAVAAADSPEGACADPLAPVAPDSLRVVVLGKGN
ncbi:MAG: hypothetical protein IKE55_10910 [Kiritimatiellae bacterium]|nr:hypothetical protein [Kiritimatiellia bacterium]